MNRNLLRAAMVRFGDTGEELSAALGIARSTLSAKMTSYKGADFTQNEILTIKNRYNLSANEIDEIFFNREVS